MADFVLCCRFSQGIADLASNLAAQLGFQDLSDLADFLAADLVAVYRVATGQWLGLLAGTRVRVATSLALAYEAFVKIEIEWARASAAMHIPLGVLYVFALIGFLSAAVHSAVKIPYANRPERKLDISEMEG